MIQLLKPPPGIVTGDRRRPERSTREVRIMNVRLLSSVLEGVRVNPVPAGIPSTARRSSVHILRSLAPPGLLDEWLELADGYRGQVNEHGRKPIVVRLRKVLCRGQGE